MLLACGGGEDKPVYGPLQDACLEIAERYCCGIDKKNEAALWHECATNIFHRVCNGPISGADQTTGCPFESCARSDVDFPGCFAALDAVEDWCAVSCDFRNMPGCTPLPGECVTKSCPTAADGCVEEPWVAAHGL